MNSELKVYHELDGTLAISFYFEDVEGEKLFMVDNADMEYINSLTIAEAKALLKLLKAKLEPKLENV